jgi:hypothetical protein
MNPISRLSGTTLLLACLATLASTATAADSDDSQVSFSRDILPLLAKKCFACHGPAEQEAGLALHTSKHATAKNDSGLVAVVPGKPDQSQLMTRIRSNDPDSRMPHDAPPLTQTEIARLETWIAQGAVYEKHWSFVPPRRHAPPNVADMANIRSPIDRFVIAQLNAQGLRLSPEAKPHTLVRRLSLDLVGLLPSRQQTEKFVANPSELAYQQLVDQLLASPHFGERWGRHWLDLARYADSFGYERDDVRPNAWRYRDWVIRSINNNQPYNRFIIEQLAGDLIPNASQQQKLATGLHRMNIKNNESGINKDDYRNRETVDRVNTTATAVLGLTLGCAQCHSHKYDPIPQTDFYAFYAFFNNIDEKDVDIPGSAADQATYQAALKSVTRQQARLKARRDTIAAMKKHPGLAAWQKSLGHKPPAIAKQLANLDLNDPLASLLSQPADRLAADQQQTAAAFWKTLDGRQDDTGQAMAQVSVQKRHLPKPYMMTVAERPKNRRATHVLLRGDFKQKGPLVQPATPSALPPLTPRNATADRLDLARWIVSTDNPLSARVAVNHVWAHLFGRGLVATHDDFGNQGSPPSHPLLLDWLAIEFTRSGWDRKSLIKQIVTSATYRQSSSLTPRLAADDPNNLWLARQSRYRVEAEIVRDLFLDAAGLLHRRIGGTTIHPVKPDGTEELAYKYKTRWIVSDQPDRHRRGMYILFKRTNPYPSLMIFDSPGSNVCLAQRNRSNTPLQALTTLNDPVFFECAQALGHQLAGATTPPADRIQHAALVALSRPMTFKELRILKQLHADEQQWFAKHPDDARQVAGNTHLNNTSPATTAAWISVARTLLNLDEFLTRQ